MWTRRPPSAPERFLVLISHKYQNKSNFMEYILSAGRDLVHRPVYSPRLKILNKPLPYNQTEAHQHLHFGASAACETVMTTSSAATRQTMTFP